MAIPRHCELAAEGRRVHDRSDFTIGGRCGHAARRGAAKMIPAMRERSKNLRKLVKPLQGRDRETRGAIRGAIPRAPIIRSRGNAATSIIEISRDFRPTAGLFSACPNYRGRSRNVAV